MCPSIVYALSFSLSPSFSCPERRGETGGGEKAKGYKKGRIRWMLMVLPPCRRGCQRQPIRQREGEGEMVDHLPCANPGTPPAPPCHTQLGHPCPVFVSTHHTLMIYSYLLNTVHVYLSVFLFMCLLFCVSHSLCVIMFTLLSLSSRVPLSVFLCVFLSLSLCPGWAGGQTV